MSVPVSRSVICFFVGFLLVLGQGAAVGTVLCIGAGGYRAIEVAVSTICHPAARAAGLEAAAPVDDDCPHPCRDIPLSDGQQIRAANGLDVAAIASAAIREITPGHALLPSLPLSIASLRPAPSSSAAKRSPILLC